MVVVVVVEVVVVVAAAAVMSMMVVVANWLTLLGRERQRKILIINTSPFLQAGPSSLGGGAPSKKRRLVSISVVHLALPHTYCPYGTTITNITTTSTTTTTAVAVVVVVGLLIPLLLAVCQGNYHCDDSSPVLSLH